MPTPRTGRGITKYLPIAKPSGVTADPLCVFHFSPAGDYLTDRTGNGRDATVVTGTFEFGVDPETGLYGLRFGDGDHELVLPDQDALRIAQDELAGNDASLTLEAIVRQDVDNHGIIVGCDGDGESLATNYLWQLGPNWDDAGVKKYSAFTEYGGGTNNSVQSSAPVRHGSLIYLALTISADGKTWKWWSDAVNIGSATLANAAEKNSAGGNTQRVRIGRQRDGNVDFKGLLCSLRITAEVFDQADFEETLAELQGELSYLGSGLEEVVEADTPDEAVVQDVTLLPDQGGPAIYQTGLAGPQLIPGPITQQVGSVGPFDDTQIDDVVAQLDQSGQESYGVEPVGGERVAAPIRGEQSTDLFDEVSYYLSILPDYRTDTNDFNGHPHFIGERVVKAFIYDAVTEAGPWTTPTDPSFTGYGKDGVYYIAGVAQGSNAPWYDEAESDDRGPTKPFPDRVLVCLTRNGVAGTNAEVVFFDLDNYPTSLDMWMRWKVNSGGNSYYALGNEASQILDIAAANGVLVIGSTGTGSLHVLDFKGVGQDCGFMVRSNDDWIAASGKTIADRNTADFWTTTGAPGFRIDEEDVYSVAARMRPDGRTWVACAGEDPGPDLFRLSVNSASPDFRVQPTGEVGDANIGDVRKVIFDEDDHWWISIDKKVFRIPPVDYEEGLALLDTTFPARRDGGAREWVELFYTVLDMAAVGEFVFIATEKGVYRLHRGTFELELAYTINGYGGGGKNNTPPAGEIIPGDDPEIASVKGVALNSSHFLFVANKEGVAVIRVEDDLAVDSREYPDLFERGAHFNVPIIG